MPMGIVEDELFIKEVSRVSNGSSTDFDTDSANPLPNPVVDTTVPLNEEISDYEPKESGNIGLELRAMESSNRANEDENVSDNSRASVHQIEKGRPAGRHNRTPEEREIIAGEALLNGVSSASKLFGVHPSIVSAYKNGATSTATYNEPDDELLKSVSARRIKIAGVAHGKLSAALDQITNEKLQAANLKTIASVAQSMSAIIKNMEPEVNTSPSQNIQFTFYAPKVRSEEHFDVIDLQGE